MKMKIAMIGALVLLACIIPGCLGGDKIVGTWEYSTNTLLLGTVTYDITFNSNNTGVLTSGDSSYNFTWTNNNGTYILTDDNGKTGTAKLSDDNKTLKVTLSFYGFSLNYDFKKV